MRQHERLLWRWLTTPPAKWSQALCYKRWQAQSWHDLAGDLDFIVQRAAMLAEYIATRKGMDGTGTREHAEAMKAANKLLVKIRRALGYTYPERGTFNF